MPAVPSMSFLREAVHAVRRQRGGTGHATQRSCVTAATKRQSMMAKQRASMVAMQHG